MKGISKVLIVGVLVIIIAVSSIAVYWYSTTLSKPQAKQELVVGVKVDPGIMDPAIASLASSWFISHNHIHEALLRWETKTDGTTDFAPCLAESYTFLNATHVQFKLRQGVKFHDGSEFDAYSVNYSLNRIQTAPFAKTAAQLKDGKCFVVDKYTLIIYASFPMSTIPSMMSIPYGDIVGRAQAESLNESYGSHPIGTGPYKLVEWVAGERIVLEAFDDYWGGRPKLDKITFLTITDDAARVAALESGQVDMIISVPPTEAQRLEDAGFNVPIEESARTVMIPLNYLKAPFNDTKVRQAVNYAVDKEAICNSLYLGLATPAYSFFAPSVWGYKANQNYTYNPEKARQLLAEAGYPNGFDCTFWSFKGRYLMDKECGEAVVGYLADVGINVNMEVYESAGLLSKIYEETNAVWTNKTKDAREYDMIGVVGLATMTMEPDYLIQSSLLPTRPWNLGDWVDPRVAELNSEARATFDTEQRKLIYYELQDLIGEEAPQLLLHVEPLIVAMDKDVHGVDILANEAYQFANAYIG